MIDEEYYENFAIGASQDQEYFVISNSVSVSLFKTEGIKCVKKFRLYDAIKAIFSEDNKCLFILASTGYLVKINMNSLKIEFRENKLFDELFDNIYLKSNYLIFAHAKWRGKSLLYGQVIQYNYLANEIIKHTQMENKHKENPVFYTNKICFSVNSSDYRESSLKLEYELDDEGRLKLAKSSGILKKMLREEEIHETRSGDVQCIKYMHDHSLKYEVIVKKRGKPIFKLNDFNICGHIVLGEEDNYILYTHYTNNTMYDVNILNLNTLEIEKIDGESRSGCIKPLLLDKKKKILVNINTEKEKIGELPSGLNLVDFK